MRESRELLERIQSRKLWKFIDQRLLSPGNISHQLSYIRKIISLDWMSMLV